MRALPGLNDLRVFEVAARLENFRQAAEQLHLTHGAVSHRIRALEAQLDVPLFERVSGGVKLTGAGRELLTATREALGVLQSTTDRLARRLPQPQTLRITSFPSLTAGWLGHRLHEFHALHPELHVKLELTPDVVSLEKTTVDVALRFGPGHWSGLHAEKFLDDYYYPVATPALIAESALQTPQDLLHAPLIHNPNPWSGGTWLNYFSALGLGHESVQPVFEVDDGFVATQLARGGVGVLLGRHTLVADAIANGQLARVGDALLESAWGLYFVASPAARETRRVQTFRDWLFAAASQFHSAHQSALSCMRRLSAA